MPMCACYLLQYCFKTSRFGAKQQTSLQHQILRHSDWRSMGECGKSCPNPKVPVPFCEQATREVPKGEAALLQQQVVLAVKGINVWISTTSSGRSRCCWKTLCTIWMASILRWASGAAGWVRFVNGAYTWYIDHFIRTAAWRTILALRALAFGTRPHVDFHVLTSVSPLTSQQHWWVRSKRNFCIWWRTCSSSIANHEKFAAVLECKCCVVASWKSYAI